MIKFYTFLLVAGSCIVNASCENDPGRDTGSQERGRVNEFIAAAMDYYYLWRDHLPGLSPDAATDPKAYFNSLLYEEDYWSYITDDKDKFMEEEIDQRGETFGYNLSFGTVKSDGRMFAVINYVYPGSPASRAGMERGVFILRVDGDPLSVQNYARLHEKGTLVLTLGELTSAGLNETETVTLVPVKMEQNPVLLADVMTRGSHKIGYLMYTGFVSYFQDQLVDSLMKFKNAGIDDLVLDLRYNPGGEVNTATLLCSAIVPPAHLKKENILVKHQWNADRQAEFEWSMVAYPGGAYEDYLQTCFDEEVGCNLGLSRVFVLTSRSSASASELLITGLAPYMEVIQVGDSTRGKYTAMAMVFPNDASLENWMLLPVVYKYMNKEGFTDFKDGLAPRYLVKETLPYTPFGLTDPLLATAIMLITGEEQLEEIPAAPPARLDTRWIAAPPRNALEGQLLHRMPGNGIMPRR